MLYITNSSTRPIKIHLNELYEQQIRWIHVPVIRPGQTVKVCPEKRGYYQLGTDGSFHIFFYEPGMHFIYNGYFREHLANTPEIRNIPR